PRPLAGERADVHLVDHLAFAADRRPLLDLPGEGPRIDHARRPMGALRLETRRRIGHGAAAVETELVERARAGPFGQPGEVAPLLRRQFDRALARRPLEDDLDAPAP